MLYPVFARAGSDKNAFIEKKVRHYAQNSHKKTMILVPEQSSFETEKQLYLSLGDRDFSKIEVVSFTRLCSLIFAKYGKCTGERLTDAGKLVLCAGAVESAGARLSIYGGQAKYTSFAKEIAGIIDELKIAGISPENLKNSLINFSDNELLFSKLSDISEIYSEYDLLLKNGYLDEADEISSAAEKIGNGEFFCDYNVIVDDFASFNGTQLDILEKMIDNCDEVTLILCSADIKEKMCPPAFKTPQDTYKKIRKICSRIGAQIAPVEHLKEGETYNNKQLCALECIVSGQEINSTDEGYVSVSSAISPKMECRHVAARIKSLVMNEGIRYRDIVIVGREMSDYLAYLEDSLRIYDIPFFSSSRASIDSMPVSLFIIDLLETLINNIDTASFVKYLKCPISPIDSDDAAQLESYIEMWRISGSELKNDFTKNPNGLDGQIDEEGLERLNTLNEIRKKTVLPLIKLKGEISRSNGERITRAIYKFMEDSGALKKLSDLTHTLNQSDSALASEQYRAYKTCLSVLSQLSALLKGNNITLKRYLELFKLALNAEDVGSIPHHLDEVQIADSIRVRIDGAKVVFLVGVNEGVFPKRHKETGFFSDSDRKRVRDAGIDMLTPASVMNQNEEYYLYNALCRATDKVYISYARNSSSGEAIIASKIVKRITQGLDISEINLSKEDGQALFGSDEAAFELLCKNFHTDSTLTSSLKEYFKNHKDEYYRRKLSLVEKGTAINDGSISPEQISRLYGETMMVSPSQIEKYHLCEFSHFCRYALNLKPIRAAEITAMDTGNAIHEVMERLLSDYTVSELSLLDTNELSQMVEKLLREFLSLRIGDSENLDNRIKYSIMRLKSTIVPVIRYVIRELETSGFTPRDFELNIRRGSDIEPYMINSSNGKQIGVYGKVDRVDTLELEDKTLLRVIDYKSGTKDFVKSELDYGLNLQMFLYLFSILKNGKTRYNSNITPSGVLYMPAKKSEVNKKGAISEDALKKEIDKGYKMKGIVLEDEAVRRSQQYFSVSYEDISEFSRLENKIEEIILKMADELMSGNLKVNPLYVGRENRACKFCDYHQICGFEEGDSCNRVEQKLNSKGDENDG